MVYTFLIFIIFSALPCMLLGILLLHGKGAFLISGYNMLSQKEKAGIDEAAVCRFTGKMLLAMAGCFVVTGIGILLESNLAIFAGIVAVVLITIWGVAYCGLDYKRFRKNEG